MDEVAEVRPTRRQQRRIAVYAKCGGCCAYCGDKITLTAMQVDHVHPKVAGGTDHDSNLLPSCRACNNYKLFFTLEQFRAMIAKQITLLRRHSMNYRTAERYGLVEPKPREIVFYFEHQPSDGEGHRGDV